jgi:hypothetical protein
LSNNSKSNSRTSTSYRIKPEQFEYRKSLGRDARSLSRSSFHQALLGFNAKRAMKVMKIVEQGINKALAIVSTGMFRKI